jgi:hypothetical protein
MKKRLNVQQKEQVAASAVELLRQGGAPTKDKVLQKKVEEKNSDLRGYALYPGIIHAKSKGMIVWKSIAPKGWVLPVGESGSEPIEPEVNNSNAEKKIDAEAQKPIRALGLYWERSKVNWNHNKITLNAFLGSVPKKNLPPVNMSDQKGIYILYDGHDVVYVGRTTNTLGDRLRDHTRDVLQTRWNRFSWFGFLPVDAKSGKLEDHDVSVANSSVLAAVLEAVLITSLEPPLNWRSGDHLKGKEYIQVADPDCVNLEGLEVYLRSQLGLKSSK